MKILWGSRKISFTFVSSLIYFAEMVTWRWGFWFWAIGSLFLGAATLVIIPHSVGFPIPGLSLKRFDYLGTCLGVTGLILFAFAWNQASVVGWQEPYTYALLIVGIVFIVAFAFTQSHVSAPVLPNSLWTRKGFSPIVTAMSLGWMSFGISFITPPTSFSQFARNYLSLPWQKWLLWSLEVSSLRLRSAFSYQRLQLSTSLAFQCFRFSSATF